MEKVFALFLMIKNILEILKWENIMEKEKYHGKMGIIESDVQSEYDENGNKLPKKKKYKTNKGEIIIKITMDLKYIVI